MTSYVVRLLHKSFAFWRKYVKNDNTCGIVGNFSLTQPRKCIFTYVPLSGVLNKVDVLNIVVFCLCLCLLRMKRRVVLCTSRAREKSKVLWGSQTLCDVQMNIPLNMHRCDWYCLVFVGIVTDMLSDCRKYHNASGLLVLRNVSVKRVRMKAIEVCTMSRFAIWSGYLTLWDVGTT